MATYFARSSGNINGAIWATTPSGSAGSATFASGDVLVANSFTVTVNVSVNLGASGEFRNDTNGGATAGGSYSLSNGVTITGNVVTGSATCMTITGTASATIVGNVTGGTAGSAIAVAITSQGTLNVIGAVSGGSGVNSQAISLQANGTAIITGTVAGGSGGSTAHGVNAGTSGANFQITGNVTGGSAGIAAINQGGTTCTIIGTVTGAGANGAQNTSTGGITVTGTVVGGTTAGLTQTNGTVVATRAKGGSSAGSAVGIAASTSGSVAVEEIEYGDLGASPTSGPIRLTDRSSNVCLMYRFNSTKKTLVDTASTSLIPAASDVRSGTVYNAGQTTGTCAVPGAASVLVGVAVDNTTGTAAVSSSAIQSACDAALAARNVATFASVGQQLSNALTP